MLLYIRDDRATNFASQVAALQRSTAAGAVQQSPEERRHPTDELLTRLDAAPDLALGSTCRDLHDEQGDPTG